MLVPPVAMVGTPWPTGSVRETGVEDSTCACASWRTSTDAERPPSRAPGTAEAGKALGSETLGWLNRLPPEIRDVKAEAKLSMVLLTWPSAEAFALLAVSRLVIRSALGCLAALARLVTSEL